MIRLAHIQSILLLAGAGLWVVTEGLGMFSGGMTGYKAMIGSGAFVCIALGITVLWSDRDADSVVRTGVLFGVPGVAAMAAVFFSAIDSTAQRASDLVDRPLFLIALALAIVGAVLVVIWVFRSEAYSANVAVLLLVFCGMSLVGTLLALPPVVQSVSDIGVAVVLAEIAVVSIGRSRS